MRPREQRVVSLLVAINLRLGMSDKAAMQHAASAFDVLSAALGGESLFIPVKQPGNSDSTVAALRSRGLSVRQIARKTGLGRQSVQRTLVRLGLSGVTPHALKRDSERPHDAAESTP